MHDERIRTRIKAAIATNIKRGDSAQDFYKSIDKTWKDAGFHNPKQLQNVYQTNLALAFGAGQKTKIIEHAHDFPYWMYSAVLDSRTRPSHAALNGKIFKATDTQFLPPLGFRCRCTAIPLTAEEAGDYTQNDFITQEQKNTIIPQLSNIELFGNNKEQKFIDWLNKIKDSLSNPAKKLINKAEDFLTKDTFENNLDELAKKLNIMRGKPMSFQEANEGLGNINFKLSKKDEYKVNCQCCVVSHELRRRGLNVTAAPNFRDGKAPSILSKNTEFAWIDPKTGQTPKSLWAGYADENFTLQPSIQKISSELNDITNTIGRYHIKFVWKKTGGGHIISFERLENGDTIIYDPQSWKKTSWKDLSQKIQPKYGVQILRVDNLLTNNDIVSQTVLKL